MSGDSEGSFGANETRDSARIGLDLTIALIVATDRLGVIGREGALPWRLRSDLQRFKRLTMGHVMVMGRKTYDSIGRPLPGRLTIVMTRDQSRVIEGVSIASNVSQAIEFATVHEQSRLTSDSPGERPTLFVVGGAEIYRLFLDIADELHETQVDAQVDGDTWFPVWDPKQWDCVEQEEVPTGDHDQFATLYRKWRRRVATE